jgi:RNA polymerase primary sigma factor
MFCGLGERYLVLGASSVGNKEIPLASTTRQRKDRSRVSSPVDAISVKKIRPQPEPRQASPHSPSALRHLVRAIQECSLDFIRHASFSREGIERQILAPEPSSAVPKAADEPHEIASSPAYIARLYDTALLTAEQERHLFRQMNYLLYRAHRTRRKLNLDKPSRTVLKNIQADLQQANLVKARLIQANLRLVVSIAKKFVNPANLFEELISDGNVALIRAVEKFNFALGNRFSTYATYAIQRNYFRTVSRGRRLRERFHSDEERLAIIPQAETAPSLAETGLQQLQQSFSHLLHRLNKRERQILEQRFGFHDQEPKTFKELGEELGVCKERIRQIQTRALEKLRQFSEAEQLLQTYDDRLT